MLLVQVTVIHLIEKFTTVTETKGYLQHHRIPLVCLIISQCNAFQFSQLILVRSISVSIHLPLGS